jgi:hypothetical protein
MPMKKPYGRPCRNVILEPFASMRHHMQLETAWTVQSMKFLIRRKKTDLSFKFFRITWKRDIKKKPMTISLVLKYSSHQRSIWMSSKIVSLLHGSQELFDFL